MKKLIWVPLVYLTVLVVTLVAQTRGTPNQLRVKIDSTGALVSSAVAVTNPVYTTQFSNARLKIDSAGALVITDGGGAGFAPADATYITQTANATLTNEQALSSLSTGLMNVTTTTGVVTSIANVAAGQLLASGTPAAYTANPSVSSITVKQGTGAGTMKASGVSCQDITNPDTSVQNAWNYKTCTIPASALISTGDMVECEAAFRFATNANTKTWQYYWNGGTCSGSGASACATGDQIESLSTAGSATRTKTNMVAVKTGSNAQAVYETTGTDVSLSTVSVPGTATESSAIPVVLAYRNTSASAATTNTNIAPILVCSVKNF